MNFKKLPLREAPELIRRTVDPERTILPLVAAGSEILYIPIPKWV